MGMLAFPLAIHKAAIRLYILLAGCDDCNLKNQALGKHDSVSEQLKQMAKEAVSLREKLNSAQAEKDALQEELIQTRERNEGFVAENQKLASELSMKDIGWKVYR